MTALIFNGREYAQKKLAELAELGRTPALASLYRSTDPGSALYTRLKKQTALSIGVKFNEHDIAGLAVSEIITLIKQINADTAISGILVQKPAGEVDFNPSEWAKIVMAIDSDKDIDGLTPQNLGLLAIGTPKFIPATVKAVLSVIAESGIKLPGKKVVIIGASEILGKPLCMLLTDMGATVSLLHKLTDSLTNYTQEADLLISATGFPGLIGETEIKPGAVVIDVGAPKGDIRTEEVMKKAAFLSPVPGGVGPITIACLLENLLLK